MPSVWAYYVNFLTNADRRPPGLFAVPRASLQPPRVITSGYVSFRINTCGGPGAGSRGTAGRGRGQIPRESRFEEGTATRARGIKVWVGRDVTMRGLPQG